MAESLRHSFVYPQSGYPAELEFWFSAGRPAVIARPCADDDHYYCGICLPLDSGGAKKAFKVSRSQIDSLHLPPPLSELNEYGDLSDALDDGGFCARVFGSRAWQYLTGLEYVHENSDLDLTFMACTSGALESLEAILPQSCECDAEISVDGGRFFSWREFQQRKTSVLVKNDQNVSMMKRDDILETAAKNQQVAVLINRLAIEALREELELYPKPGLVSMVDCGSHQDMDFTTFEASIGALDGFFTGAAIAGMNRCSMRQLKLSGLRAERRMFAATGGVNTHRGAIFSLGLLAAAAGRAYIEGHFDLPSVIRRCWSGDILADGKSAGNSHGAVSCEKYTATGAREEAAGGFASVFSHGLDCLRRQGPLACFFKLMEQCSDTNLLYRGGMEALDFARDAARRFFNGEDPGFLHRQFVERKLSPGGSADLFAATVFIDKYKRNIEAA